jgi:hypothetical protein
MTVNLSIFKRAPTAGVRAGPTAASRSGEGKIKDVNNQ